MIRLLMLLAVPLSSLLVSATSIARDDLEHAPDYQPLSGVYKLYGGELSDPVPPTRKDQKLAIGIEGEDARRLFEAIGPDIRDACTEGTGIRVRARRSSQFECIRWEDGQYRCSLGIDLNSGKPIPGSTC
ncbi:hypothetical protein [Pseudomonas mangiferae]|uniref:DUF3617 domain-containing protein n=1 Tax=Pseudomonas mangiferae TaxID=2593654 RepID=A0A553H2K3_9PSED|nr:hypothetical protein [Pseudomonas mangiferae]TRX75987.1 hypothetical protein FM069_06020 [Pseudomonas mangiferae]